MRTLLGFVAGMAMSAFAVEGSRHAMAVLEHRGQDDVHVVTTRTHGGFGAHMAHIEVDAGAKIPDHREPSRIYVVVAEGGGTLTIDGVPHAVREGDVIFLPHRARTSYRAAAFTRLVQIYPDEGGRT